MKALELVAESEFEYKEVDNPQIKDEEVLIRVKACGICGSDVHGMDGSSGRRIPPIIMGHEASGVIEALGSSVDSSAWKPGDRVTFDSMVYCGECWHCRRGETNLCDNRMVLGVSCGDYRNHGAFAEFVAVPERILYKLPDSLSFEHAALTEAVSVAVHAVDLTPIQLDDSAVVVGSGMIGLLVIQSLKAAGCGKVIAVDLDEERLALAKKLGASETVKADSGDVLEAIRQMTEGRGADHAFEVVGMDPTLKTAIDSVRKGGTVTLVGNLKPVVDFALQEVVTRQINLIGTCGSAGEYPACLNLIADGTIRVDEIISATVPLSEGASWFDRLYKGEKGLAKVILKPE